MLTITSNEQANLLVKNGVLAVDDDIEIAFDGFRIEADIRCKNIYSKGKRRDINVLDIDAFDIYAGHIYAGYMYVLDINATDIIAESCKYTKITCNSIKVRWV